MTVFALLRAVDSRHDDCSLGAPCPDVDSEEYDENILLQTKLSRSDAEKSPAKAGPSNTKGIVTPRARRVKAALSSEEDMDKDLTTFIQGNVETIEADVSRAAHEVLPSVAEIEGKATAASRSHFETFFSISSKINTKSIREFAAQAPDLIHTLRLKGGLKGPMHYPHMHISDEGLVKASAAESKVVASFTPSLVRDDRLILGVLCLVLIAGSTFYNLRGKSCSQPLLHVSADIELLSMWDGTVTTFSSIFGTGFLCLPYAMSLAGWIAVPMIIFFTGCAAYTGHMLTWALHQQTQKAANDGWAPVTLGWGFLLGASYGPRAGFAVNVFLIVELWGYFLFGIVAAASNLGQLLHGLSVSSSVVLAVLVQLVLTAVPMKALARLNVVCNVLFIICCLMFIVTGLLLPVQAAPSELVLVKPGGIVAACGIIVFSPASHSLYPSIMQRLEKPEQFPICLRRAYVLACIIYVLFAASGYYLFGNAVQPSAVRNIGVDRNLITLPNLGWMNYVAAFSMLVKVSGLQPLILSPLSSTIDGLLRDQMPRSVSSTLIKPMVLAISGVVAIHFVDKVAYLLNLVGSIFCMSIAFVLPVLCYWQINAKTIGVVQKVFCSGLIIMGGGFATLGLITALDA